MTVGPDDVRHVAHLARIRVSERQLQALATELNGILLHMVSLPESSVRPDAGHGADAAVATALRNDAVMPIAFVHARATFAPEARDGFFLVPRVITHR